MQCNDDGENQTLMSTDCCDYSNPPLTLKKKKKVILVAAIPITKQHPLIPLPSLQSYFCHPSQNSSLIHLSAPFLPLSPHYLCVIHWSCAVVNYNRSHECWREGLACGTQ